MVGTTINIALSSDRHGFEANATLIASIVRRASLPVWVKMVCQQFLPKPFEIEGLKVDFIPADELRTGRFPRHVGPATFDRVQIIRDAPEWDRCFMMDYDEIALCDLAPLFSKNMGKNLMAARMHGSGIDLQYAMRTWLKDEIPSGWAHTAHYPYFCMGPLMNLSAMRQAGTWEKFLRAHEAFNAEEQIALCAATEGRVEELHPWWNRFAQDIGPDEVPECVVHWYGWPKPWHPAARVWRPDVWESEKCSWAALREGLYKKPSIVEVGTDSLRPAKALARRGWNVWVEEGRSKQDSKKSKHYPDMEIVQDITELVKKNSGSVKMVRFGSGAEIQSKMPFLGALSWLRAKKWAPQDIVICGPAEAASIEELIRVGYVYHSHVRRDDWPVGGPDPSLLNYHKVESDVSNVDPGVDLYLRRNPGKVIMNDENRGEDKFVGRIEKEGGSAEFKYFRPFIGSLERRWKAHLASIELLDVPIIRIVMAIDLETYRAAATTLHSIIRRTEHPLHCRCYCFGFHPEDFYIRNLYVEFVRIEDLSDYGESKWSGCRGFDSLQIIKDHPADWDRCWILSPDSIVTADLAKTYFQPFEGALVRACTRLGVMRDRLAMPTELSCCGEFSVYDGPIVLNLRAMDDAEIWSKLTTYQELLTDARAALVIAIGDNVSKLEARWAMSVYDSNLDDEYFKVYPGVVRPDSDWFENFGIVQFTNGPKPWVPIEKDGRSRLKERSWFREYSTWGRLLAGDWGTPYGCEKVAIQY